MNRTQFRTTQILLLSLCLFGCRTSKRADGNYEIQFRWNNGLQDVHVFRDGTREEAPTIVRAEIVKNVESVINDQFKKANLTKGEGKLEASVSGQFPYVILLSSEVQVLRPNFSELRASVEREDTESIRNFILRNHNVNQREMPSEETALFIAASGGLVKSLRMLLALDTNVNIPDYEAYTPLHAAVTANSLQSAQLLIEAGAKVDAANGIGWTPLMLAANLGREDILRLLLHGRANCLLRSSAGKTALDLARDSRHKEAITILENANCR